MTGLPPPVAAGSRVAIVFPAGRPGDDQSGLELLSQWGLEPVIHDAFGTRIKPPQLLHMQQLSLSKRSSNPVNRLA